MRDRWRRVARFFGFGAIAVACAVACGTANGPDIGGGENPGSSSGTNCGPGKAGCPCTSTGESAACGDLVEKSGDYVTCSLGHSTCDGSSWGPCVAHDLVIKSVHATSLGSGGLHFDTVTLQCGDAGADGGALNPCDPNPGCGDVIGQPSDVDANGVKVTPGGITLGNGEGGSDAQAVTCSGTGLACSVAYCAGDAASGTTVSGTVYDPAGNNPLYNVIVYIPNAANGKLTPFPTGVQCTQCASTQNLAASLGAVTATYTDVNGNFTLTNAPYGTNIPIVVQSGKWRREILLTSVTKCAANPIPAAGANTGTGSCTWNNPNDATECQLHLPRNQYDGYDYVKADGMTYGRADLPQIAIVSGSADPLECILLKAGIDPSEVSSYDADVSPSTTHHHIHFYESDQAPGATLDPTYGLNQKGSVLWLDKGDPVPTAPTPPHYDYYDLVMLPCEGNSLDKEPLYTNSATQGPPYANIIKYADMGGRVFTTHFGYTWLQYPGRSPSTGNPYVAAPDNWGGYKGVADWTHYTGTVDTSDPLTSTVITTFPKGLVFEQWLQNVGATTTLGQLTLHQARQDLTVSPDVAYAGASQPWMTAPAVSGGGAFDTHFTFNTPFNAAAASQCGRVVYSDFHVSASALVGSTDSCAAATDALGRTTFEGCGFSQQCVCGTGSSASVTACTPPTNGTCSEPCGTVSDCADSTYACNGAILGGCGPGVSCNTSSCTPQACTQDARGNYTCPGGGFFNCDRNSHLCVCQQDGDCPTGALCVNNGQCGFFGTCSGTGAYDGANCTTTATCASSTCETSGGNTVETCVAGATATCPLANHVCNGTKCACAADSDCPTDGKCLDAINNCPNPALCTAVAGTLVDSAECTIATNNVCFGNSTCGGVGAVETCRTKGTCSTTPVACAADTCGAAACTGNWLAGFNCPNSAATCSGTFTSQTCLCTADAQCASGKCINNGQNCPTPVCSGSGAADTGYCTIAGEPTTTCTNNNQCIQNGGSQTETCQTVKVCLPIGADVCHHDIDCPSGKCVSSASNGHCGGLLQGPCSGSGTADSASCQVAGAPATCTTNGQCTQLLGTVVESCSSEKLCEPAPCSGTNPCPNGRTCVGGVCTCGNDNDCPGTANCVTTSPSCPVPVCSGTGTADSAGCVPVATAATCPSSCGTSGLETCVAATGATPLCPIAGHVCGSGSTASCLCATNSDCASGQCINSASNCPNPLLCTGIGTGDGASCVPVTGSVCTTVADCPNVSATADTVTCLRPKSCAPVACTGFGNNCPGTTQCGGNNTVCQCMNDTDCPSGKCVPSKSNNDCKSWQGNGSCSGSGAADSSSCQLSGAPTTCTLTTECGNGETCAAGGVNPTLGQCSKACTTTTQCTGHETCNTTTDECSGCTQNSNCTSLSYQATCIPTNTTPVTGKCCYAKTLPESSIPPNSSEPPVDTTNCGLSSHQFPESCAQEPLTSQEKALEFMFFDITSCVQPDTGTPPSGPPAMSLVAETFPLDFTASCGDAGGVPVWRELDFTATFPSPASGASISITAQTGTVGADGGTQASTLSPTTPITIVSNDQTTGSTQVFLDTAGGYQDAGPDSGTLNAAGVGSQPWLHLLVTLTPTTGGTQSPTLVSWNVIYDCPPME
jgi:hypothetical protein